MRHFYNINDKDSRNFSTFFREKIVVVHVLFNPPIITTFIRYTNEPRIKIIIDSDSLHNV